MSRSVKSQFRWSLPCLCACGLLLAGWVGLATAQEVRTWSDASGKFKIKGTFKGEKDGVVTIEQEDGEEIEVETKKLSSSDQRLILVLKKEVSDNPFKKKDEDPFKPKGKSAGTAGKGAKTTGKTPAKKEPEPEPDTPDPEVPEGGRAYAIRWSEGLISPGLSDEWKVPVPAAETTDVLKIKNTPIPAFPDFFDKFSGAAISPSGKKAAITYQSGRPGEKPVTRVALCDLVTGKVTASGSTPGEWAALAMHNDGKQVVVRSNKFGFDGAGRMEAWFVKENRVEQLFECAPFSDLDSRAAGLSWAEFVDENQLMIAGNSGRVAVLAYPEIKLVCYAEAGDGSVPAISPDRKLLAYCDGDNVVMVDIASQDVIGKKSLGGKVHGPRVAFSPTGKRLACAHNEGVSVLDVEKGDVLTEIPSNGARFNNGLGFPDDKFVFAGNSLVLDVENQVQLWEYRGAQFAAVVGETTYMAMTDHNRPGLLFSGKLPHPAAVALLEKMQSDPNLFVFKSGSAVKLDFSAIADQASRDKAIKAFTAELTKMKCTVSPNAALEIRAKVTGPTSRQVTYSGGIGTHSIQEWITSLEFVFEGKTVWMRHGGSNVPFFISLKQGDSVEAYLRSQEKPNYHVFLNPVLPKFVQRPRDGQGVATGAAMGTSEVSVTGIR
jgi:hypothetical protein